MACLTEEVGLNETTVPSSPAASLLAPLTLRGALPASRAQGSSPRSPPAPHPFWAGRLDQGCPTAQRQRLQNQETKDSHRMLTVLPTG